jgi:putative redox protein
MKARIKWVEESSFLGETESGHAVLMDGPPAGGGRNLGPRPMEMLLIGTGACTAYDVVNILKKSRQQITDCVVDVQSERADADPKVFTNKSSAPFIYLQKNTARHPSCWGRWLR